MDTTSFSYDLTTQKWSVPTFPELDSDSTLVLAFGSSRISQEPDSLRLLKKHYPKSHVVGCSSAGEIFGDSVRDDSLSVAVSRFEKTQLRTEAVHVANSAGSYAAGESLGKSLQGPKLRAVFVLSEGLQVNGSELVRGLNAVLGEQVIVTGGLGGDGTRFEKTWVSVNGEVGSGMVCAVGFYGDHILIGHGSKGGWDRFGPERVVTRSAANVVFEIDGEPALDLYKKYLGDKASELPSSGLLFPLAIRRDENDEKQLVRTLLAVDEEQQSLTFAGDVPAGYRVQLMKANFDRLIDGATGAALAARDIVSDFHAETKGTPLAVAVSCVGRRLVLGSRAEDEIEATLDVLADDTPLVGFYSYGELSPFGVGNCELHNQTMTLTTFSESVSAVERADAPTNGVALAAEVEASEPGLGLVVKSLSYDLKTKKWSAPLPELDSESTLVLAFGSSAVADNTQPLRELKAKYPSSHIVGCSSAGEIFGDEVMDDSVSVAITRFGKTKVRTEAVRVEEPAQSFVAGRTLGERLAGEGLRAVFVLSEGLKVNGSELVRGMNAALPPGVVLTGGMGGDGTRFEKTWVTVNGKIGSGLIAAVGLYGDHLLVGHGSQGGWDRFGPERIVTRSEANVVFEIDEQPALALYKKYLGDKAAELPSSGLLFPLAMRRDENDEKVLVRTLLAVDEEKQSLTFAGDVPKSYRVQLMKANFDRLVEGATGAAEAAKHVLGMGAVGDHLAVAVSCVGRRLVLGSRVEDEVDATLAVLPENTALVGFYSYGELSPYGVGSCELHNQTMTLTSFAETKDAIAPSEDVVSQISAVYDDTKAISRPDINDLDRTSPALAGLSSAPPTPAASPTPSSTPPPVSQPAPAAATSSTTRSPTPEVDTSLPSSRLSGSRSMPGRTAAPQAFLRRTTGTTGARIVNRRVGDIQLVTISGKLSESFRGREVGKDLSGIVLLDLLGVERVTSFGVREWIQMLEESATKVRQLYFTRCSEAIVSQLGMIRGFAGAGQIISMLAPYLCNGCGTQFSGLLDARSHHKDITAAQPPKPSCPACESGDIDFDDDPRSYFTFLPDRPPVIPAEVDEVNRGLQARVVEAIEKEIDGQSTRITLHAELDGVLRWQRPFDGLEGHVVIDLSPSPRANAAGAERLGAELLKALGPNDDVEIIAAPAPLLEWLRANRDGRVRVTSAVVEGRCTTCGTGRRASISLEEHGAGLARGETPDVRCKRHPAQRLDFTGVKDGLLVLAPPAPAGAETTTTATTTAAAVAAVPPLPVMGQAPPPWAMHPPPPRDARGSLIMAGGVALGIIGLGALFMTRMDPAQTSPAENTPAPVVTQASAAAPPPVADTTGTLPANAGPAGVETAKLPPEWVTRPFVLEGDDVFIVGQAGPAPVAERLVDLAYEDAVVRLILEAEKDALQASAPIGDGVARERLVRRFGDTYGRYAAPVRVEVDFREGPDGVSGSFRYKLSKAAFDQLVSELKEEKEYLGMTVGRVPLTVATQMATSDELLVRASKSWAATNGVKEGDTIRSVAGELVRTPEAFESAARRAWAKASKTRAVVVEVTRDGAVAKKKFPRPDVSR